MKEIGIGVGLRAIKNYIDPHKEDCGCDRMIDMHCNGDFEK